MSGTRAQAHLLRWSMHGMPLAQAPVLPVFADVALQPAGFLSQHLPPSLDTLVPAGYVRQVTRLVLLTCLALSFLDNVATFTLPLACALAQTLPFFCLSMFLWH